MSDRDRARSGAGRGSRRRRSRELRHRAVAASAPLASTSRSRSTIVGRKALSAASKNVVRTATSTATTSSCAERQRRRGRTPRDRASSTARRGRSRSGPVVAAGDRPTRRRRARRRAPRRGPCRAPPRPRRRPRRGSGWPTSGRAIRVMSEPKIEIVAAAQTPEERAVAPERGRERVAHAAEDTSREPAPIRGPVPAGHGPALHFARLGASEPAHHRTGRAPLAATRPDLTNHGVLTGPCSTPSASACATTLGKLTGRGRISEADVDAAMREVRLALLEADVNFKVVKDFVARVRERAIGAEVLESLTAGQQVVKIVNEELSTLLSAGDRTFRLTGNPAVVAMVGLQGSGKTTSRGQARPLHRQAGPPAAARRRRPVPAGRRRPARDPRQAARHPGLSRAASARSVLDIVRQGVEAAKRRPRRRDPRHRRPAQRSTRR